MSASIEEEMDICYKPGKNNVPMLVHVDLDKNKTKKRKIGDTKADDDDSTSIESSPQESASSAPTTREEKLKRHREIEIRRRKKLNATFEELAKVCNSSAASRQAILTNAKDTIVKQDAEIKRLQALVAGMSISTSRQNIPKVDSVSSPRLDHSLVFQHSCVAQDIVTINGQFLDCNHIFSSVIGYSKEELLDHSTFYSITHPESMADTITFVTSLLTGPLNTIYTIDKRYVKKGGLIFSAHLVCWLSCDETGKPKFIHGVLLPYPSTS